MRLLLLALAASPLFAQCSLITILGTDVVSSSRAVINANFDCLNTLKAPKASPVFTGTVTFPAQSAHAVFIGPTSGTAVPTFRALASGDLPAGTGTITNIATTTPITGGTITATGTIACPTCVTASSPGLGLGHFAGSTQALTSSLVVEADQSLSNVTTLNVSASKHGYAPILPNDATVFFNGAGGYTVVPAASVTGSPHPFGCSFNGGGAALTTGNTCYFPLPSACSFATANNGAWDTTMEDGTDTNTCAGCSITYKVWKIASTSALPTSANSISTTGLTSAATRSRSTVMTDFTTTSVAANDTGAMTITAVSGSPVKSSLILECQ